MTTMYRQGDVLIRRVEGVALPDAAPEPRDALGRLILAAGEVTGHHHAVDDPTATLLPWVLADGAAALAETINAAQAAVRLKGDDDGR